MPVMNDIGAARIRIVPMSMYIVFFISLSNVSVHRRRLVRRTVERLVRIGFHFIGIGIVPSIFTGTVNNGSGPPQTLAPVPSNWTS